uniref:F-box domain-containing protein n=1 Tax=Steinernema glaseri TaxID=37863 RepID=A0A1I7Y4R3_9BILA
MPSSQPNEVQTRQTPCRDRQGCICLLLKEDSGDVYRLLVPHCLLQRQCLKLTSCRPVGCHSLFCYLEMDELDFFRNAVYNMPRELVERVFRASVGQPDLEAWAIVAREVLDIPQGG